jgi:hypothetical protein
MVSRDFMSKMRPADSFSWIDDKSKIPYFRIGLIFNFNDVFIFKSPQ